MRISEITNINEIYRPNTQQEADEILRDAGYERIGGGAFGAVYKKNENQVLKTFTSIDVGFLSFIKLAKESNNNPHFPLFYGNPIKVTKDYYAIKIENLSEYRGNSIPIRQYIKYLITGTKIGYNSDFEEIEEIKYDNPRFDEACNMLANLIKSNPKFRLDLHEYNIMKRGRTLVFSDPIAISTDTDILRKLPDIQKWDTRTKQKPEKPFVMTPSWEKIFKELENDGVN
jgi:hypothetical protein